MNKQIKFCLLLTGLLLAGNCVAADRGSRQDRMHQRGDHGGPGMSAPLIQHLSRAVRRLDLSDDQQQSIRADLTGLRETLKPLAMELRENRKELQGLITASNYDADAVAANAQEHGALTAEITTISSATASLVLAQLTDAQRAELKTMNENRKARRNERRAPRDSNGS